jgi:hypothetical protein
VVPCILVHRYQWFGGMCCIHLHGIEMSHSGTDGIVTAMARCDSFTVPVPLL